jgi:hypothetical protein
VPLAGDGHAVPVVLHADAVDEAVVGDGDAADPGVAAVVPLVSPAAAPWANLHELLGHNHPPLRLLLLKKNMQFGGVQKSEHRHKGMCRKGVEIQMVPLQQ